MFIYRTLGLVFAALLCLATPGFAQTNTAGADSVSTITTAVPFLTISPWARNGGLGDAGVANTYDASAEYWNPACLAFTENKIGAGISYVPWLRALGIPDINLAYLPFYYNMGERGGTVGASFRFFSLGEIQFTDEVGTNTGKYNASELALSVCYAHIVTDKFSVGGGLRYFRSDLASGNVGGVGNVRAANSVAGDVAVAYKNKTKLSTMPFQIAWGLNISNIGPKVNYNDGSSRRDFIPTNLRIGYALRLDIDEYNSFSLLNDFNKLMVPSEGGASTQSVLSGMFGSFSDRAGREELQEVNYSIGGEYWYNNLFAIRAGYFHEAPNKGDRQYLTLGAGLKFKVFVLDFAYLNAFGKANPLQNTLRFSMAFNFGEPVRDR
jgi:Type IX secretion system protein PorV